MIRGVLQKEEESLLSRRNQVQCVSCEANCHRKFEPLDTRDFVDFSDFEDISIAMK